MIKKKRLIYSIIFISLLIILSSTLAIVFIMQSQKDNEVSVDQVMAYWTQIAQQHADDCLGFPDTKHSALAGQEASNNWRIQFCKYATSGLTYTRVIKRDNSAFWEVPFFELYGQEHGIADGAMRLVHWSNNEKYGYFAPYYCCLDGLNLLFKDELLIYRLDLLAGMIKLFLPSSGSMAFSPDDRYFSYSIEPHNVLYLRDLERETEYELNLDKEYPYVGLISWSPDSKNLVFIGAMEDWAGNIIGMCNSGVTPISCGINDGFTLLLLNRETMKIETLINNDPRLLRPLVDNEIRWKDNENIFLEDNLGNIYIYNIKQNRLLPFSTPAP